MIHPVTSDSSGLSKRVSAVLADRVKGTVVEINQLTETIKLVTLRVHDEISFLPGQFIGYVF